MRIVSRDGNTAIVSSGRASRQINIGLLRNVKVGDYVIVHAGFAIEKLDIRRAEETLRILKEIQP